MSLVIEDLTVTFGGLEAVAGVDLAVEPGRIVALLGPSGCGKSTLLRAIAGLQPMDTGSVRWNGEDLGATPVHDRGIGLMFQDHTLFPHRDVAANVAFGLRMQRVAGASRSSRVEELLAVVGLPGFGPRPIETLSGGEAQRVALARALAPEPRVLLLDEPYGSLDRPRRDRLIDEVPRILRSANVAAIHVTHDHDEAFAIADGVAVMERGRVRRFGSPRDVWCDPRSATVARFLGHTNLFEVDASGAAPWGAVELGAGTYVLRSDAITLANRSTADVIAVVESTRFRVGRSRLLLRTRPGDHPIEIETGSVVVPGDEVALGIDWTRVPEVEHH